MVETVGGHVSRRQRELYIDLPSEELYLLSQVILYTKGIVCFLT